MWAEARVVLLTSGWGVQSRLVSLCFHLPSVNSSNPSLVGFLFLFFLMGITGLFLVPLAFCLVLYKHFLLTIYHDILVVLFLYG